MTKLTDINKFFPPDVQAIQDLSLNVRNECRPWGRSPLAFDSYHGKMPLKEKGFFRKRGIWYRGQL